jgi:hypothetical protein
MNRAIQESLQGSYNDFADEAYEEAPIEDRVRLGNRYVIQMHIAVLFTLTLLLDPSRSARRSPRLLTRHCSSKDSSLCPR